MPLVEAMAYGVPVLAWPAGAVAYTLGGAAPAAGRRHAGRRSRPRMLALARDPARRAALAERQRRSLDRFRLDRAGPVLLEALAAPASAAPRTTGRARRAGRATCASPSPATSTAPTAWPRSTAHLAARDRGRARPAPSACCRWKATSPTDWPGRPGRAARRDAARCSRRPPPAPAPEVVISQHYPVWVPPEPGDVALGAVLLGGEPGPGRTTVATLNAALPRRARAVRVVAKALIDSGVRVPVRVVGHAPRPRRVPALRARARRAVRGAARSPSCTSRPVSRARAWTCCWPPTPARSAAATTCGWSSRASPTRTTPSPPRSPALRAPHPDLRRRSS